MRPHSRTPHTETQRSIRPQKHPQAFVGEQVPRTGLSCAQQQVPSMGCRLPALPSCLQGLQALPLLLSEPMVPVLADLQCPTDSKVSRAYAAHWWRR